MPLPNSPCRLRLDLLLEEIGSHELVICGVHLDQCVESTLRMARSLGFMVFLPQDCVVTVERTDRHGKTWSADEVLDITLAILDGFHAKVVHSSDLMALPENETLQ